jgi:PAS domain S-box-containing protein
MRDYKKLVEKNSVIIFELDKNKNIVFANQRAVNFFSIELADMLHKNICEIVANPIFMKLNSNGGDIFIYWILDEVKDEYSVSGYVLSGIDISKSFKELKESKINEKRFNTLFNNVIDSVYVYKLAYSDKPGAFLNVNKVACDTLGYKKDELLKKTMFDIDALESFGDLIYVHRILKEQKKVVFETIHKTKKGDKFPVEISAHLTNINDTDIVFAISRDITEQKREREELRQLAYFARHNPSPVIRFNKQGYIIHVNKAAVDVFGINIKKSKVKVNKISKELKTINTSECIENGDYFIKEVKVGDRFYNFTIIGVKALGVGQIYTSDITKTKELSKMKEDFIAIVSHDLRSPFNGILGFAEILLEDQNMSEENKEIVSMIQESAEIQLDYINSLLDLISFEQKEIALNLEPVFMEKLVKSSINALKILADKKNISIKMDIAVDIPVYLDYPKITQVINNLISNALKFTSNSGNVKITCFQNKNEEIELHVIDNGIGIRKDKQKNLFQRYSSIRTQGTNGEVGTGLGLSICRMLVRAHGGEINVNSKLGEGSDFYFTIPIKNNV